MGNNQILTSSMFLPLDRTQTSLALYSLTRNIDFVDVFIIRHSSSELDSALIYSNIQVFN